MSDESDDKQFDATEQKLRQAREKGDVPRSNELNSALMYFGLWGSFTLFGAVAVPTWIIRAARLLGEEPWPDHLSSSGLEQAWAMSGYAAFATIGAIALIGLCVLLGQVAQRSLTFTPSKLAPDLKRINPFKNAGQKFGKGGLINFSISLGKAALVMLGGWMTFQALIGLFLNATFLGDQQWVAAMGLVLLRTIYLALGVSIIFAGIDLLWKNLEYRKRNRMSRKDMMDEHKESEGDPHFKAARRQKGFDLVMTRMLDDVQNADVIVVNPTHYAVALEWKRGSGVAPVCLAKGVDEIAARIRERAVEHGVPIWSDPPNARALYATVEVGAEIQTEHFAAVAAAIRYAEIIRKKMEKGWGPQLRDAPKGKKP